ncbi:MAG: TetR/AcrR family transcriptional regulator [Alphaproteobacteria bacterium]
MARRPTSSKSISRGTEDASPSARRAILDAAVEALEHRGESTIRISEIARKAGVAVGLIYYHFEDREGLVSAAQIERMLRTPADDVNLLEAAIRLNVDADHFTRMIGKIVCTALSAERASMRLDRVAILGASKGRPAFTTALRKAVSAQTDRLAEIIEDARRRGIVDPAVGPRALATLIQALAIGLVVADLDETPVDQRQLVDVFLRSMVGFMGPAAAMLPKASGPERKRPASAARRAR